MNHWQPWLALAALCSGGGIFLALGLLHGALTLRDLGGRPRAFTPPDPALRAAMQRSSVRLHPSINLWRAWLGFNLTHSLGLVLFGTTALAMAAFAPAAARSTALAIAACLVAALYLAISMRFFFVRAVVGSALGLACFGMAAVLSFT